MAADDPNMPKWALEPLVTEASPLQPRGSEEPGTRVNETGSLEDYDSDLSDEDLDRVSGRCRNEKISIATYLGLWCRKRCETERVVLFFLPFLSSTFFLFERAVLSFLTCFLISYNPVYFMGFDTTARVL